MEREAQWNEWSRHVLAELQRINDLCEILRNQNLELERRLQRQFLSVHTDIAALNAKAITFATIASCIGSAVVSIIVTKFTH